MTKDRKTEAQRTKESETKKERKREKENIKRRGRFRSAKATHPSETASLA